MAWDFFIMKRVSFYLMLFVAAVLMASCSNDEIMPEAIVPEVTFPDGSINAPMACNFRFEYSVTAAYLD